MGMSTHVIGFRPPDDKWQKMKAVWDACQSAGTEVPKEVEKFFNYETPDEKGIEVDLKDAAKDWTNEGGSCEGFEVEIAKLPKHITYIRFYNSW